MEKMVGSVMKRIAIFLVCISQYLLASDSAIILSMQDMNHKPISQVKWKSPFILQVELRNLEGYTESRIRQYITGIENFKSSQSMTSRNMSIDNGKKTVKTFYNFVLRADKKGKFTVGHVLLHDNKTKQPIKSNRLIIPVGDELILSEKDQKDKYFVTIESNKNQLYVGEKLNLRIKFYDRLFVDDLHLQFPDFQNLHVVTDSNKMTKNMVTIDDEEYSVTEWVFDMYPTKAGSLEIKGIHAAFFAPELESKFKIGSPFDFFRSLHKSQQRIEAQLLAINVIPLPDHQEFKNVTAVGQFSKFTVAMSQKSVAVGQGIIVATELFGHGNFEIMEPLSLDLPEGFTYYDSNMVTINTKRTHKHSEFIVQAHAPGTYSIEPQSLVYFDPIAQEYKKIYSNSIGDIIISQGSYVPAVIDKNDDTIENDCPGGICGPKQLQDFVIIEQGAVHAVADYALPINLFQHIISSLLALAILLWMYQELWKKYLVKHPFIQKYSIYSQAMRSYQVAVKHNEMHRLYALFMQLFTRLIGHDAGHVTSDAIILYLQDKKFSEEQIVAWQKFYEQILEVSFAFKLHQQQPILLQQILSKQALDWIQALKEKA